MISGRDHDNCPSSPKSVTGGLSCVQHLNTFVAQSEPSSEKPGQRVRDEEHLGCHFGTFEGAAMAFQSVLAPMMNEGAWSVRPDNDFPTLRILSNETASQDVSQLPWLRSPQLVSKPNQSLQSNKSASLPAILAALIPSLTSAVVLLCVFVIIKRPFRRIYSPRTFIDVIPEKSV